MAKVEIIIDAVDQATKELKGVNQQLDKMDENVKQIDRTLVNKNPFGNITASWTEFASAYGVIERVVSSAVNTWNQAATEVTKYADEVQKLSVITGQSTEETSRQIQIADDLRVSYEALSISLRTASKKGIDTSIEGLIKLGEEYKKLPEGIARTQFLMEKFGRSGVEMDKILKQTAGTIRDLAASQPDGLILSQADIQKVNEYNVALGDLNDSLDAIKTNIVLNVAPSLTELFHFANDPNANTAADFINKVFEGTPIESAAHKAERLKKEIEDTGTAAQQTAGDIEEMEDPLKAAEEAAKQLSASFQTMLSNMFAINQQNERYNDTIASLAKSDTELTAKKQNLTLQMWEEQRAGKLTNDEYLRYIQQIDDINKSIDENAQKRTDAAKDLEQASAKQIYDLVQQRLAADGIINSGEFEYLQDLAVQKGLVTRKDADQAIQASRTADALVASFQQTQGPMDQALSTMQQIASYNGVVVNFGVNFTTTGGVPSMGGLSNTYNGGYTPINFGTLGSDYHDMDSGGQGMAGTPYLIGTGAQPELFVPKTDGTFYPNGKGLGNTYNITVNNPKKETAENSIRAALKNLSFLGVTEK